MIDVMTGTSTHFPAAIPGRLRWRCRRGIREMDLLLERFLDCEYAGLSSSERQSFEELLTAVDADLMSWLTGRSRPDNPRHAALIDRLRGALPDTPDEART
jgi:antitoxin CptB